MYISVLIRTCLNENKEEARGLRQRKDLLANISLFDGKDKKACLMWVNHVEHTARQAKMSFREAVNAKAGPTVVTVISRYPNASDAQLKKIILESFSNVGTRIEATQYLKKLRLNSNEALAAHNTEYEAVHTVAYGVTAEHQTDEVILLNYANTLCDYASGKLRRKILRRNSYIKTLKDAMEEAEELDSQSRQEEISKLERDSMREVTLSDSINNISLSEESVNFMQTRRGDSKFNSTMKNGHQNFSPNNKGNYSGHNSYNDNNYNGNTNYNGNSNYNNKEKNWHSPQRSFNKRRLQRYKHQPRWPKRDIKFKYNARDQDLMGNLRRTINFMKEGAQNREAARRFPRLTKRATEEVSEENIATIEIEEIQTILNEDIDLIFDALVIGDYIEDEEEA